MFSRLQTRLTVLYAALFGAVLLATAAVILVVTTEQARQEGAKALSAAGDVFDRLWEVRTERLRVGATLLSRDYGFREALATRDMPTITSAVENLRSRLGLDLAFVVAPDGRRIAGAGEAAGAAADALGPALRDGGDGRGVAMVDERPFETVAAPILAPDLKGWIVFAVKLDEAQMRALTKLSPLPLDAQVVRRAGSGWTTVGGDAPDATGGVLTLVRPLDASEPGLQTALRLSYPLRDALAPYRRLLWLLAGVGALGLVLVIVGGWALARSVTQPLKRLSVAARELQTRPDVRVSGAGRDELGDLGRGFNAMADAIEEREARLLRAARTDGDTGLPNRPALETEVAALAAAAPVAVVALGVERFARMRGVLGFELSALLLRALGERLQQIRPEWTVARTSADILSAAFPLAPAEDLATTVEEVRRELQQPQTVGEHLIDVRLTAGVTSGADASALVREAEMALDAARAADQPLAVFDPAARRRAAESLGLMPALRRALREDALQLHHQPKHSLRLGRTASVESLVRWSHPQLGPQAPDRFVTMAEETGDIRLLTEWVAERAVAEQAELAARGRPLAFSINLSGRLVGDADITRRLLALGERAAAPLCVEVTETAVMGSPDAALKSFAQLREAGITVSIDDYGSGLSSLAYLKQIAADELKLDRCLVADLSQSARDALLVRSTIDLAHALGMSVTAEGVEDRATVAVLAGLGCDTIQGWVFARAMPLEALVAFLDAEEGAPPAVRVACG